MNYGKIFEEDIEGCSSNESGWTSYLVSPERERDRTEDECYEDYYSFDERVDQYKKNVLEEEDGFDSDDSMASDASSGRPSDRRGLIIHGRDGMKKNEIVTRNQKLLQEGKRKNDDAKRKQMKYVGKERALSHRTRSGERSKMHTSDKNL